MKLRKAIKMAATGAVASVLPGIAIAVPPSIVSWELDTAGNVVHSCDAGYTCSDSPITDKGFRQVTILENDTGFQYILTVNAEGTGDLINPTTFGNMGAGGFADANVIMIGAVNGGIHAKSEIEDEDGDVLFTTGAQIASGWAADDQALGTMDIGGNIENVKIILNQSVIDSQVNATNDTFSNVFAFMGGDNTNTNFDGKWGITEVTGTTDDGDTFNSDFSMKQLKHSSMTAASLNSTLAAESEYKQIIQSAVLNDTDVQQVFSLRELSGAAGLTVGGTIDPVGLAITLNADPALYVETTERLTDLRIDQTGSTGTFGKQQIQADGADIASLSSLIQTGPYYNFTPDPFVK